LMVAEMTGTLSLLAPAMIAVAISTAVVGDETIYRAQLRDRFSSSFYRARLGVPVLATVSIGEAQEHAPAVLPEKMSVGDAIARLERLGAAAAIVVNGAGGAVGSVSRESLARVAPGERTTPISGITVRVTLLPTQSLEDGIRLLAEAGTNTAPVVDGDGTTPTGLVTSKGILRAYRVAAARAGSRMVLPAEM
jgi:CIC family chloride channel protein